MEPIKSRRVAFIVDIRNWAFDNVARSLCAKLQAHTQCAILYWEDFSNPALLLKHLSEQQFDHVHFFFREHLKLLLSVVDGASSHYRRFVDMAVSTHVPDYLYSNHLELLDRATLFNFVDGYFTTCRDLHELYCADPLVADPDDVIFDWPDVPVADTPVDSGTRPFTIVWSGNSKWGESAGFSDYKGLNAIIEPAVQAVRRRHPGIEFVCCDSAVSSTPREQLLDILQGADVLLIASLQEGTPLTLIEAMGCGCAVVTTDVGIAREVLPASQQFLIIDRDPQAFEQALETLISDQNLLRRLQRDNVQAYTVHFGPNSPLLAKWVSFLNLAYERSQQDGRVRKEAAGARRMGWFTRNLITGFRSAARLAQKLNLIKPIGRYVPGAAALYNRVIHGGMGSSVDYERLAQYYERQLKRSEQAGLLVVYAPMWRGVAASTEALFEQESLRFPYSDQEFPEVRKHVYLEALIEQLRHWRHPIVYSGGSVLHIELSERLRRVNPQLRQFFAWHGSPAQWVEPSHRAHFDLWRKQYDSGVIDGIITIKPGLNRILERLGINSWDMFNPIPDISSALGQAPCQSDKVQVGLFSAISSWYKNPHVQALALAGRDNVVLKTNLDQEQLTNLELGVRGVEFYPMLPRTEFLRLLDGLDVNLYVTNTECSPMSALESWALSVPCIVGPAGDVYSAVSPRLGKLLVEQRVDDPDAISRRLDLVLAHREEIVALLQSYRTVYMQMYEEKRVQLVAALQAYQK